jgi:tripartite-type tricarboxylate transporter receptor subunit TctC
MIMRRLLQGLLALALVLTALSAGAQNFPGKPVHFIVPYAVGGITDLGARIIAQKLGDIWGQPVVVENRVGANGMIAIDHVARSSPDGYTILMCAPGFAINPSLYPDVRYNPVRDFAPVIHILSMPNVLVVHPAVPARSVKELIAMAKAQPGKIAFSSAGIGSSQHLSGELLKLMTDVDMRHVPYKGSAPSVLAVVSGEVALELGNINDVAAQIRADKMRALAVTGSKRVPALPEVPTMVEAGVSGYDVATWIGVVAPAGTPRGILIKMNQDMGRVLRMPDVLELLSQKGSAEIVGGTPEQFDEFIRAEVARWASVVKKSGIKVE